MIKSASLLTRQRAAKVHLLSELGAGADPWGSSLLSILRSADMLFDSFLSPIMLSSQLSHTRDLPVKIF